MQSPREKTVGAEPVLYFPSKKEKEEKRTLTIRNGERGLERAEGETVIGNKAEREGSR